MYCEKCGAVLPQNGGRCAGCGNHSQTAETGAEEAAGLQAAPGILLCRDGMLRWTYELSLWRNPAVLITLLKVFYGIAAGLAVFMGLLMIGDGAAAVFTLIFRFAFYGIIIATGLILTAYALYAVINGGKYCVVFEMDEKGVRHIQIDRQFKKMQVMSLIGMLAGAAAGSMTAAGANMIAGSRQSMYSQFKSVVKIKAKRRRNVLYVNEILSHNQIYANEYQFDYVFDYIKRHCPPSVRIEE